MKYVGTLITQHATFGYFIDNFFLFEERERETLKYKRITKINRFCLWIIWWNKNEIHQVLQRTAAEM